MNALVPDDPATPMDVRAIITRLVDDGTLLEVHGNFARNLIVGFARIEGLVPGDEQDRGGIIRHGAKMLFAYASSAVSKLTAVLRKAYGGSYLAMCSQEMGADTVYAWPMRKLPS